LGENVTLLSYDSIFDRFSLLALPYATMSVLGIDVGNATSVVALARRNGASLASRRLNPASLWR